eukprot:CAMPEP_0197035250 /NCGR_PEP_ID=MMETSP1384-20130603/13109_1 /TAXON_ID=29189 /ORGANISM="Ammonia sp." /LENGTH=56 /DNA_ID=CAMNT_0042465293 /DNA_START=118 /DNA_END=285 /DNA_ORIENTATION=+
MNWLYFSAYILLLGSVQFASSTEKDYESNSFDTYNADECPRVRRAWYSLTDAEKQQ